MTYDTILNTILFAARIITFGLASVLLFNLIADIRNLAQEQKVNGVWATRLTMIVLIGALWLENAIYSIGYIHGNFGTIGLNVWLSQAKLLLIMARLGVAYGVFAIYKLFCCKGKK
jgi:hypothetical protein